MTEPRTFHRMLIERGVLKPEHVDALLEEGVRAFQKRRGLVVDGLAGAMTRAALEDELKPSSPPPPPAPAVFDTASVHPRGKGMYMSALVGTPDHLADELLRAGCEHVALLRVWQTRNGKNLGLVQAEKLPKWIEVLKRRGLDVGLWAWSVPGQDEQFAELVVDFAAAHGCGWAIDDGEAPWKSKPTQALRHVEIVRGRAEQRRVGLVFSCLGQIRQHGSIPYEVLMDVGSSQTQCYVHSAEHPGATTSSFQQWRVLGARNLGVAPPLWGCTPAQLTMVLEEARAAQATHYTAWRVENGRKNPALVRAFAAFRP